MPISDELQDVLDRRDSLLEQIRETVAQGRRIRADMRYVSPHRKKVVLLMVAEGLIAAHRAARADGDGATIDIIQDAMIHVGRRLTREANLQNGDARRILGYYNRGEIAVRP